MHILAYPRRIPPFSRSRGRLYLTVPFLVMCKVGRKEPCDFVYSAHVLYGWALVIGKLNSYATKLVMSACVLVDEKDLVGLR
jgi:hypothetical protein